LSLRKGTSKINGGGGGNEVRKLKEILSRKPGIKKYIKPKKGDQVEKWVKDILKKRGDSARWAKMGKSEA